MIWYHLQTDILLDCQVSLSEVDVLVGGHNFTSERYTTRLGRVSLYKVEVLQDVLSGVKYACPMFLLL